MIGSIAPLTLERRLHLAVHVDHDGARRRVCERPRKGRRLVVVVGVGGCQRTGHRIGHLTLCGVPAGACANATPPISPPVPSVATLASRNLRIAPSLLRRPRPANAHAPHRRALGACPHRSRRGRELERSIRRRARSRNGDQPFLMAIRNTVIEKTHGGQARAPIAPTAWQTARQAADVGAVNATEGRHRRCAARASCVQRAGPRAAASGWLKVGKVGDRKASPAPARCARSRSVGRERNW